MTTQLVTTPLLAKLRAALSANFPPEKVDEACLVNGGKFVEAVLKCLQYRRTGNEVDALTVNTVIKQLESDASLSDAEKTTIPRTLQAIYEFRNKRGGAHNFSFDPMKMDCAFVVAASNWVTLGDGRIDAPVYDKRSRCSAGFS